MASQSKKTGEVEVKKEENKLELEGNTLGERHRHYNKLIKEVLKSNQILQPLIESPDNDIYNMIKIDIACKTKNIEYILDVLKSEDQLFTAKVIKQSTWLITDPQYDYIIQPEYLYTELYPNMTLKAFNKLILNVRLHLKDEKRVEAFYEYIKAKNLKAAHKWLINCSVPFVEKVIKDIKENPIDNIEIKILRRLYRKSFSVYEAHIRRMGYCTNKERDLDSLLKMYPAKVLDFVDCPKDSWRPLQYKFGPKSTKLLMKNYAERILNNIELYGEHIHAATFVKYLKSITDVENILLKHVKYTNVDWLYANDKIRHSILQMPRETRLEFVRKIFTQKDYDATEDNNNKNITACTEKQCMTQVHISHIYVWYKFAPFEKAFTDLCEMIRTEPKSLVRHTMLHVLLSCALCNKNHTKTVLQYYHDKHFNEAFKFKIQFINCFITNVNVYSLDDESWNFLYKLFHSMDVFTESENNVQRCIKAVIIRNVIYNEPVPTIIEKKFKFDTMKTMQNKLEKQEHKEAIFKYLHDLITIKSRALNIGAERDFNEAVILCEQLLLLIKDWGKELHNHPYALFRVKELITIKNKTKWSRNLATLYNVKKSWRKLVFEESIVMMQNQAVCINALKHDPGLLFRYKDQIISMCCNDAVSLRDMLRKIRIYWPRTLAENWKTSYLNVLRHPTSQTVHKAVIESLCALFSQEQIKDLLKKYAPSNALKYSYLDETDQLNLSLSKQVAKNVHKARSLPPLDGILLYTKDDYLHYAEPSLSAVLSQYSPVKIRTYIPILIGASSLPLKKFGIQSVISKLNHKELIPMMSEIWDSKKYTSIRIAIFSQTFQLLCKGNNTSNIEEMWTLLSMFIDKLSCKDSMFALNKLAQFHRVPASIQPQFYMKSFGFVNTLPAKYKLKNIIYENMQNNAINYVEYFDNEFVTEILLNNLQNLLDEKSNIYDIMNRVIPAYILVSKDEDTQIRRYDNTLDVILEQYLPEWGNFQPCQHGLEVILGGLISAMETYTFEKKMIIPLKVFHKILMRLESALSMEKHYVFLTMWKLATAFVLVLNENKHILLNDINKKDEEQKKTMLDKIHDVLAKPFAELCVQYLKEDMIRFGNSIYMLLADSLKLLFHWYLPGTMYETKHCLLYLKSLLQCETEPELYLMVCHNIFFIDIGNAYSNEDIEMKLCKEIYDKMMSHYSDEIKMCISEAFNDIVLPDTL